MRLVIVSGLSGSGKSVALNLLEDMGFYCIDNVPAMLLETMVSSIHGDEAYEQLAVGIDARNRNVDLAAVPAMIQRLQAGGDLAGGRRHARPLHPVGRGRQADGGQDEQQRQDEGQFDDGESPSDGSAHGAAREAGNRRATVSASTRSRSDAASTSGGSSRRHP